MPRKNRRLLPPNVKIILRKDEKEAARRFKDEEKVIPMFKQYEGPGRLVAFPDYPEGA